MPGNVMESVMIPKIRKRGCSSSSSTSSRVKHYRYKRVVVVGKARGGHGLGLTGSGSRSSTPAPTWRMTPSRAVVESPKYCVSGRSGPVSARRLAATLWEMNVMPTPKVVEKLEKSKKNHMLLKGENLRLVQSGSGSGSVSGSLPHYLSDPSYSPVSEKMGRSVTGSRHTKKSAISPKLKPKHQNLEVLDSVSAASLMEMETRPPAQTICGSVADVRNHLKDVSSVLTTSKELLKIINRIWANADQPASSMSLVSALHAELERARLLVNHLIQEQRSDETDICYLIRRFAEEKAAWKIKEKQTVESAVESVAGKLEVERKLRQRFESLNKKLGKELVETKALFMKAVKELEGEKRAREVTEQVCDELARNIDEDKSKMDNLVRESAKIHVEVDKERDKLHEERNQMKVLDGKHHFEEKNSTIERLRKQLEVFLGKKRGKEKGNSPLNLGYDQDMSAISIISRTGSHLDKVRESDGGEVDDVIEEGSTESDLHSIELNRESNFKIHKWPPASAAGHDSRRASITEAMRARSSLSGQVARRSASLQRSISDVVVEWDSQTVQNKGDVLAQERPSLLEKQSQRKAYVDETERYQLVSDRRDRVLLSNSMVGSVGGYSSPTRLWERQRSSRDSSSASYVRSSTSHGSRLKSRFAELGGESYSTWRAKW